MQLGRNMWGGRFLVVFGGKLRVGKIENKESNGALDFDGFCWMGGRNNLPKVGRNDGIYFGETAHRAMTLGESAVASFGPTNACNSKDLKCVIVRRRHPWSVVRGLCQLIPMYVHIIT